VSEPLLSVKDLRAGYGDAVVLEDVSFDLAEGASLAVLGRNGVGKSTLLLTLMGFTSVKRGTIAFRGREIRGLARSASRRISPWRRAPGAGISAQSTRSFPG
jgi:branched-chain amino acid transport system ATP-binding protein